MSWADLFLLGTPYCCDSFPEQLEPRNLNTGNFQAYRTRQLERQQVTHNNNNKTKIITRAVGHTAGTIFLILCWVILMVVDSAVNVKEECVFSAVEHTIRGKEFQWYADSVGSKSER